MPAAKETQEFVERELPYKLLMALYKDSRISLRKLGNELGISYHVVQSTIKELEKNYALFYTLELDETKLGFAEGRIVTLKFKVRPTLEFLEELFKKDVFVQDAYLAEGDFDLLLYVIGLSPQDFQRWQWKLRTDLGDYAPIFKTASVSNSYIGFLPLRSELINESAVLSKAEKMILTTLNNDSRMKLSELSKKTKLTSNKIIYLVKKLRQTGIIKKFSALTQKPDKGVLLAYGVTLIPIKEWGALSLSFAKEILTENVHEIVNDYPLVLNTNGTWDVFHICAFTSGESLIRRGPDMLSTIWEKEAPRVEKAVLTGVLAGKWPFHLEEYSTYKKFVASKESQSTDSL